MPSSRHLHETSVQLRRDCSLSLHDFRHRDVLSRARQTILSMLLQAARTRVTKLPLTARW